MYRQQIAKKTSPSLTSTPINNKTIPTPSYGSLSGTIQRATANPETLGRDEWRRLDGAIGTRATNEIKSGKRTSYVPEFKGISAQLWGNSGQIDAPIQRKEKDDSVVSEVQPENKTGLPDNLKAGVENLSGYSLDDVRVHYNSSKPSQLQALAYTKGTNIHVAPRQEKHLPHEAWHVVQQMQGRVKPTVQMKGVQINDDKGLEKEADVMGSKVAQGNTATHVILSKTPSMPNNISSTPIQRLVGFEIELSVPTMGPGDKTAPPGNIFQPGPNGTPCPARVKKFLTNGLRYGRTNLGRNSKFRLSADHNQLAQRGRDVFTQLNVMGYAPQPFGNSLSNLEYATKPLDELAPNSTRAFTKRFNAIRDHINGLFPAVNDSIIPVPNTNYVPFLGFLGHRVYAGIPVNDFQTWLGHDYNQVQPQIQAVQNATQSNHLYLQATAGIIPSALPDLLHSQTQRNPANPINRYQYVANIIEDTITALFNEDDFQNHAYVTNLQANHPVDYEAFKGVLFLIVAYLVGNALNKTTFVSDTSTSKNAVDFLSQTRLHRVMSEAAPTFLRNNPPPDDLIQEIELLPVIYHNPFDPNWWVNQSRLRNNLNARNGRGDIIHGATGLINTFIKNALKGNPINPVANSFETPSPHNFNPDVQQARVRNASEDQQGIPLEFRHITESPDANGLPNALMAIVRQVRDLNTKHIPQPNRNQLITNADR